MPDAVRVPDTIRGMSDFSGTPVSGVLEYDPVTAKFKTIQVAVPREVDQLAVPNTGDAGTDALIQSLRDSLTDVRANQIRIRAAAPAPGVYVTPGVGNDTNDGLTPDTPWATDARIRTAITNGEIVGGNIVDLDGNVKDVATMTVDEKDAEADEFLAGRRRATGTTIYVDTTVAPLHLSGPLVFPAGCTFRRGTAARAKITVRLPIPSQVWTVTAQPHVYSSALTTYAGGGQYGQPAVHEDLNGGVGVPSLAQYKLIQSVPDLATALPLLEATAGSSFADPVGGRLYLHTIAGTTPAGKTFEYTPDLLAGSDGQLIDGTGCIVFGFRIDTGFRGAITTNDVQAQEGLAVTAWNKSSFHYDVIVERYGKHAFAAVGTQSGGLFVGRDLYAELGPGGVYTGAYSGLVDYTSAGGIDGNVSVYKSCGTRNGVANLGAPGASSSPEYLAFLAHNNGVGRQFGLRRFEDCDFGGTVSMGALETARVEAVGCRFRGSVASYVPVTRIDRSLIEHRLPLMVSADAEISNSIIKIGTTYTGGPSYLGGTLTLLNDTIDLSAGNIYATAWQNDPDNFIGANFTLNVIACAIKAIQNTAYGFVANTISGDVIYVERTGVEATLTWPFFLGGVGSATYGVVFGTGGAAVESTVVADLGVDATNDYEVAEDSPLIGLPNTRADVTDYTGTSFAARRTAGAREADSAFDSPWEIVSITNSAGLPLVKTKAPHGRTTGQYVKLVLTGVFPADYSGTVTYDGTNSLTVVSPTTYTLDGRVYVADTLGGRALPRPDPPPPIPDWVLALGAAVLEHWRFLPGYVWKDAAKTIPATAAGDIVRAFTGMVNGVQFLAPSDSESGLLATGNELTEDAVNDNYACYLSPLAKPYAIVVTETPPAITADGRRSINSVTYGYALSCRRSGLSAYFGGVALGTFNPTAAARHCMILNVPAVGNAKFYVDGVDKTATAVAVADFGYISVGTASEPPGTTGRSITVVNRDLTAPEIAAASAEELA